MYPFRGCIFCFKSLFYMGLLKKCENIQIIHNLSSDHNHQHFMCGYCTKVNQNELNYAEKELVDVVLKVVYLIENDKRFEKFFAVMLLLPFTPDNILCFIAGITKISFKRYALIVLLFKLWKIGFFCYGVDFCIDIFKIIG